MSVERADVTRRASTEEGETGGRAEGRGRFTVEGRVEARSGHATRVKNRFPGPDGSGPTSMGWDGILPSYLPTWVEPARAALAEGVPPLVVEVVGRY